MKVGETLVYDDGTLQVGWCGATFNIYSDWLECIDCFTVYDVANVDQAIEIAARHLNDDD